MPTFQENFQAALEAEKQRRKAEGKGNWGDLSPEWVNQKYLEMMREASDPTATAGGFTGVDYGYFTDTLKNMIAQGDPNQQLYRQNIQGGIDKSYNNQQRTLKQNLAQTGNFRGSGAGAQAMADIEAGRSGAIGQSEVALAAQDQTFRQDALKNLLGLQSLGVQELGQNKSYALNLQGMLTNLIENQKNYQMEYDKQNDPWSTIGNIYGQYLNESAKAGAAMAGGG